MPGLSTPVYPPSPTQPSLINTGWTCLQFYRLDMLAVLQAGHACSFTGWTCLQFYRLDMLAILQAGQWTCWQFYRLDMLAIYRLRLQIQSQVRIKMESMFRIRIKTSRLHHSGPHQGWEFALLLFALSLLWPPTNRSSPIMSRKISFKPCSP